jgi:NAD(P)-dependent dehydrogenase (short-subunit alcohol dehydrogenase family)
MADKGRLQDKVAVVTGGASGIGRGIAEKFVAEGAHVLICDIDAGRGEALARDLGASARFMTTDVSRADDIEAAVAAAVAWAGRVDCMVNNAGFGGVHTSITEIDEAGYDRTMAVLLRAVLFGMKYAARQMKTQGSGSIISTASICGLTVAYNTPHVYNAAKAAVVQLTRSVALELGPDNIRVNCLCPGFVATPIFGRGMDVPSQMLERSAELVEPFLAQMQPIRRAGQPADIAEAACWLASDATGWVTGHAMVVDGGITAGTGWQVTGERRAWMRRELGLPETE